MPYFKPKDIVAILVLITLVTLKLNGKDGALDSAFAIMIGYYFAKRDTNIDNGV